MSKQRWSVLSDASDMYFFCNFGHCLTTISFIMFSLSLIGDALQKCNLELFKNFFSPAEKLFRLFIKEESISKKKGILESLLQLFFKNKEKFFPSCHDYDHKLAKRFFQIRLHLHGREISNLKRMETHGSENSSKSVKMRVLVKNQNVSQKKVKVCDPFFIIVLKKYIIPVY